MTDDELRALLQEVDPARDLTPLSTHHVRAKAENTMTTETPRRRAARPRGRTRILLGAGVGVVAATVVVLGVVVLGAVGRGDPSVTRLTAAVTDPTASCAVLSPDLLTDQDTAFAARAVAVSGGEVTLEVTHRYRGSVSEEVRVEQVGAQSSEDGPAPFAAGTDYLLSADGGRLTGCGLSGPASPELQALYDTAFG
ncbi:hypothetical protein ACFQ46_12570 [Kineococcus sp. GCM10028916]|uniref:hypothetical protein n=1 Tax=Kineococcus sp. GCM10028916 TaxID=3273394 RepID=UPI00362FF76B